MMLCVLFSLFFSQFSGKTKSLSNIVANDKKIHTTFLVDSVSQYILIDKGYQAKSSSVSIRILDSGSGSSQVAFYGFTDKKKNALWSVLTDKDGLAKITYYSKNNKQVAYLVVWFIGYWPAYIPASELKDRDVEITVKLKINVTSFTH
ncbi:hypothetical protein [Pedobacter duraquae]|uniref:Uncharacterized protein n=1 Tax=Pedobacter duraquae TaxID=425511 RepID=A0A4R6IHB9_9SPHI|nr:hypothetical protein [Pedobacter duraquae]TDO21301.1 hypothetical protein CLV32_2405 [Pedobacter duraquae]